jgi:putative ABC transport system permease protein
MLRHIIRSGWRLLVSRHGAAIAVVLVLGIAINVAIMSTVNAVLFEPLPHPQADRLVAVWSWNTTLAREHQMAPLDFFDFEEQSSSFERLAAYYPPGFTVTGEAGAERVPGARASSGIFEVFGVRPILGRGFNRSDDKPGTARVAVISHRLWSRRFGADRGIVGRSIVLSGNPFTVVGVLPEGFVTPSMWPRMPDVWVPIGLDPNVNRRDARMLRVIGRLRAGVDIDRSAADLRLVAARLSGRYSDTNKETGVIVRPLLAQITDAARPSLIMLAAGAIALLLVAVVNTAGLILASVMRRQHELWTRLALGASRRSVITHIAHEHVLLSVVAGVGGFVVAASASDAIVALATTAGIPRAAEIHIGWRALVGSVVVAVASTQLAALTAAFSVVRRAARAGFVRDVQASGHSHRRARAALIAVQAACSLALLVGAALLARSFYALQSVSVGFDAAQAVTLRVSPPGARYPAGPILARFYDRVLERATSVPGVESAALVDWLPATGAGSSIGFRTGAADSRHLAELRVVSDAYFRTLDIPVLAGRAFDVRDDDSGPKVVVINETLRADLLWNVERGRADADARSRRAPGRGSRRGHPGCA